MNSIENSNFGSHYKNRSLFIENTKISLEEAIQRAENWRNMVINLPAANSNDNNHKLVPPQCLFRAININFEDIDQLKTDHPNASSIRLYLSISDTNRPFRICGMLVPVDINNNDMLTAAENDMSKEEIMTSASASTIYDFTLPCPTVCDTKSPLFNGTNSPDPYI